MSLCLENRSYKTALRRKSKWRMTLIVDEWPWIVDVDCHLSIIASQQRRGNVDE